MPKWAQPFSDDVPFGLAPGPDQTGIKPAASPTQAGLKPVNAEVVPSESVQAPGNNKVGNIKITFNDGHSEVVTTDGYCLGPEVSKKGNVSWSHSTGFESLGYPAGEQSIPIFLKYSFASGKVTGRVGGVGDYNKLPIWAKSVARGEASLENAPPADSTKLNSLRPGRASNVEAEPSNARRANFPR